jgi:hypothetical protein
MAPIGNPPGYLCKEGHPFGAEQLEDDHGREALQVAAVPRQAGQTVLDVKNGQPAHPSRSSFNARLRESDHTPSA